MIFSSGDGTRVNRRVFHTLLDSMDYLFDRYPMVEEHGKESMCPFSNKYWQWLCGNRRSLCDRICEQDLVTPRVFSDWPEEVRLEKDDVLPDMIMPQEEMLEINKRVKMYVPRHAILTQFHFRASNTAVDIWAKDVMMRDEEEGDTNQKRKVIFMKTFLRTCYDSLYTDFVKAMNQKLFHSLFNLDIDSPEEEVVEAFKATYPKMFARYVKLRDGQEEGWPYCLEFFLTFAEEELGHPVPLPLMAESTAWTESEQLADKDLPPVPFHIMRKMRDIAIEYKNYDEIPLFAFHQSKRMSAMVCKLPEILDIFCNRLHQGGVVRFKKNESFGPVPSNTPSRKRRQNPAKREIKDPFWFHWSNTPRMSQVPYVSNLNFFNTVREVADLPPGRGNLLLYAYNVLHTEPIPHRVPPPVRELQGLHQGLPEGGGEEDVRPEGFGVPAAQSARERDPADGLSQDCQGPQPAIVHDSSVLSAGRKGTGVCGELQAVLFLCTG